MAAEATLLLSARCTCRPAASRLPVASSSAGLARSVRRIVPRTSGALCSGRGSGRACASVSGSLRGVRCAPRGNRLGALAPAGDCSPLVVPGGQAPWRRRRGAYRHCSLAEHSTESTSTSAPASAEGKDPAVQENGSPLPAASGDAAGSDALPDLSAVMEWELDFCSRPLLDERGKRVWELLVCDGSRQLQYAEFFPSNRINSATLKEALLRVCDTTGAPKPQKIRFFRAQMQTIISKACAELDIQPVPSQRCVTLVRWLEERLEEVYKRDPSYQAGTAPLLQLEPPPPQDLPDTLRGEQWTFVQLPLAGILEEAARVADGEMFGSVLNLEAIGLGDMPPTTMIPGVAVASSRATPLSAWTSALELATLRLDTSKACLLLSTGVSDTWRYAFYRKSPSADAEARAWEDAKRLCKGLHFLAVQRDLEEEDCTGFWLLHDANPPSF